MTLPFKMPASPTKLTVMPGFAENTDQVFTELGYGPEDLAAFRAEGRSKVTATSRLRRAGG